MSMTSSPANPVRPAKVAEKPVSDGIERDSRAARSLIAWTSLLFAMLQGICVFLGAANGLRFLIGLGSLVITSGAFTRWDRFHASRAHLPMILVALGGSLLNLVVLWQIRRLRAAPSAQWRVASPSPKKLRMERLQFVLSLATIALVVVEESLHHRWLGRF